MCPKVSCKWIEMHWIFKRCKEGEKIKSIKKSFRCYFSLFRNKKFILLIKCSIVNASKFAIRLEYDNLLTSYSSFLISHENTEHILNIFHWKHFIKQKVIYFWRVLILCYFCGEERKERHIATPTFRRFCYWSTSSHTQPSFPASFQIQVLSIDSSSIYLPIHLWKWFLLW